MQGLFTTSQGVINNGKILGQGEKLSVFYHDIFDYPLTFAELIKWRASDNLTMNQQKISVICQNGYYFLNGRERLIYKRILRNRISSQKLEIAKKASKVLSFVPGIKMIAVTGSLAMENSKDEGDIDLLVITKKDRLWTSRALSYLFIRLFNLQTRRYSDKNQKDKLCLNMWMDETDITWKPSDRNLYTSHELAQLVPLFNKDDTYEKLISKNRWILRFWPNSVLIEKLKLNTGNFNSGTNLIERLAYKLQCSYMKDKITREVVTPTRAIFHPQDWGKVVASRLAS